MSIPHGCKGNFFNAENTLKYLAIRTGAREGVFQKLAVHGALIGDTEID